MPTSNDSSPPSGPTLLEALEALVSVFDQRGIRYAIIGGVAIIQHARVRTTDDIDALVHVTQLGMPALFEALAENGFAVEVMRNVRELRDEGLTTVRFRGEVVVDLMGPVIPAYAHVLERAVEVQISGRTVRVSAAEGLIVMKLIAMRPQDAADVRDLLTSYGGQLDLAFVRAELDALMEPTDPRRVQFEEWVRQLPGDGAPDQLRPR